MRRVVFGLPPADVVLAVALLVAKLVTLATGIQSGGGVASYALAPLLTLPLAWRSRFPLAVAAVVSTTYVTELVLAGYHDSVVALVVIVILPYSLGAHEASTRRLVAGMALVAASGLWSTAAQGHVHATGLLGDAVVLFGPLFAGLWVRQQRLRAQTLEQLTVQLEREREERARAAVAEERTRIARELHDEVAHAMSVIAVQADAAEGALAHDPALVEPPLLAIRQTAREALTEMRRVLGALRGDERPELAPEPGLARAGALVEQTRAAGLEVELRIEGEPAPLPPALDLAAYRVLQEGLTNVRKHSSARRVEVVLRYGSDAVGVEVSDDGDGSRADGGTGHGLAGIRERVALLGGEFVAGPRARGFALRVTLPLA
ncbi:MAG TPA: sensor histidine kinase [Candidatus Limnocylindrales bacterium]|nr:sensor histidine kinase [Candidatus Limnocylindrales bacterium]